jgi:hypothetical protein
MRSDPARSTRVRVDTRIAPKSCSRGRGQDRVGGGAVVRPGGRQAAWRGRQAGRRRGAQPHSPPTPQPPTSPSPSCPHLRVIWVGVPAARLHHHAEDGVAAGAVLVHLGLAKVAVTLPAVEQLQHLAMVGAGSRGRVGRQKRSRTQGRAEGSACTLKQNSQLPPANSRRHPLSTTHTATHPAPSTHPPAHLLWAGHDVLPQARHIHS